MGVPVVFLDPRSRGAESYKAFSWEFMAKNPTRFDSAAKSAPPPAPAPEPAPEAAPENVPEQQGPSPSEQQQDSVAEVAGDEG